MNILWVASPLTDTRGGAITVTRNIVQGLREDTHTYLGSCKYMGEMFEENGGKFVESFSGFEPVTVKNWLLMPFSFILGLFQVIKHRKLYQAANRVVVATCHTEVFFTLPWVLLWFKKPVIIMNHTGRCPQSLCKNPLRFIMKWVYDYSRTVFVSNAHLGMWKEHKLIGKNPLVVYNGVKVDDFVPRNNYEFGNTIFGYLGRLEEQKGLDTLFQSLEYLPLDRVVQVRLGGTGVGETRYKEWSTKISSQNQNITFVWLGQVQDTKDFFESIDCLLFPSKFESFGLALVEAWERGVPVLCSNITAFKEIKSFASQEEQELMFELGNSIDLNKKIKYFIANRDLLLSPAVTKSLHDLSVIHFSLEAQKSAISDILHRT
jgi:glycosyltransferase involved in cell wall biosynthesis